MWVRPFTQGLLRAALRGEPGGLPWSVGPLLVALPGDHLDCPLRGQEVVGVAGTGTWTSVFACRVSNTVWLGGAAHPHQACSGVARTQSYPRLRRTVGSLAGGNGSHLIFTRYTVRSGVFRASPGSIAASACSTVCSSDNACPSTHPASKVAASSTARLKSIAGLHR
jgi:hypothetical protein